MKQCKTNWMAIVAGASVLCSAAWVFAEDAPAPAAGGAAAPAAAPKTEIKPEVKPEGTAPAPESALIKLYRLQSESQKLARTMMAKETKLLTDKPDLQKKVDGFDEKIKALQAEMMAALASKRVLFSEADPELKSLYDRQEAIRIERIDISNSMRRPPATAPVKPGEAPAATPHVHTEGEAAPANAPVPAPAAK